LTIWKLTSRREHRWESLGMRFCTAYGTGLGEFRDHPTRGSGGNRITKNSEGFWQVRGIPVVRVSAGGFKRAELRRIERLVEENVEELLRTGNEFFSDRD
jgi:hypothetical protein